MEAESKNTGPRMKPQLTDGLYFISTISEKQRRHVYSVLDYY